LVFEFDAADTFLEAGDSIVLPSLWPTTI